jgi:cytochrome c2
MMATTARSATGTDVGPPAARPRRPPALTALWLAVAVGATVAVADAQTAGDPAGGRELFAAKQCVRCHRPRPEASLGPPLEALRRPQGAYELAGRLWNHAPAMFTVLKLEGVEWPRIDAAEMASVMVYLQADPARDPAPDPGKGQMILVAKGCLKCHAWKGEGARVGPELSGRRDTYAPAATWAAAMWGHTPRMALVAVERAVVYPRFTGDEMLHLLGFLRADGAAR